MVEIRVAFAHWLPRGEKLDRVHEKWVNHMANCGEEVPARSTTLIHSDLAGLSKIAMVWIFEVLDCQ